MQGKINKVELKFKILLLHRCKYQIINNKRTKIFEIPNKMLTKSSMTNKFEWNIFNKLLKCEIRNVNESLAWISSQILVMMMRFKSIVVLLYKICNICMRKGNSNRMNSMKQYVILQTKIEILMANFDSN